MLKTLMGAMEVLTAKAEAVPAVPAPVEISTPVARTVTFDSLVIVDGRIGIVTESRDDMAHIAFFATENVWVTDLASVAPFSVTTEN